MLMFHTTFKICSEGIFHTVVETTTMESAIVRSIKTFSFFLRFSYDFFLEAINNRFSWFSLPTYFRSRSFSFCYQFLYLFVSDVQYLFSFPLLTVRTKCICKLSSLNATSGGDLASFFIILCLS